MWCHKYKQGGQPRRAPDPDIWGWSGRILRASRSATSTQLWDKVSLEDLQEIHRWKQESGEPQGRGNIIFQGRLVSLCSMQTSTEQIFTLLRDEGENSSSHSPAPEAFVEGSPWHTSALLVENTPNNPWDAGPCRLPTPLGSWLCATVNVHTPKSVSFLSS